jgi:hypothetical protein
MKAKMQRGGLTATNRKTAMSALGIKPKSKEFDPSRFGDKANSRTTKKMQKGGDWVDRNIVYPANKWLDKNFRNPVNKKVAAVNKKIDKNFRDPVNKKVAKISKAVDRNFTDPVNKYLDQTMRKKAVAKKAVVKKTVKVKPKKA